MAKRKKTRARHDPGPPRSEIADDLLIFANNLQANVEEALKFVDKEVANRLGWDATKKAETFFHTRASRVRQALQQRRKEFDSLRARCTSADPCRPLINGLMTGGLRRAIDVVIAEFADIAARAKRPLSDRDRDDLLNQLQGLRKLLERLQEIAEWIEEEAGASRGEPVLGSSRASRGQPEPALPPEIEAAVKAAESDARDFIDVVVESTPALEGCDGGTVLGWLKRIGPDIRRLEEASNKVVKRVRGFTDRHRRAAEEQGNTRSLKFFDKCEQVLRHVAARRAISTGLVKHVVERLQSRLSLTDTGEENAHRIKGELNSLLMRLQADQRQLQRRADNATNERLANAVTAGQLPTWAAILGHGESDDGGPINLAMLLEAFVDYSGTTPDFEPATKAQLAERLGRAIAGKGRRRLSARCLNTWLDKARKLKIVYKLDRPEKLSRRIGDQFNLCKAAIRKYRRYLVRPQPKRRASGR